MSSTPSFIPVGISNRHLHLSEADLQTLFGSGYVLTVKKELSQPGQYAAEETVDLIGPKGIIPKVRVLGPVRKQTQVEVSKTDAFVLGIMPPVRDSGSISGSPGLTLRGPKGDVVMAEGCILAKRHIHCTVAEAEALGVKDGQTVSVIVEGERALTFGEVLVRARNDFALELHVDTDEANAAGLQNGMHVRLAR